MMSPAWIDLSISRITPLTRLLTVFWKPKPMPRPIAPPTTANAVRSMPTLLIAISTASVPNPIFSDFVSRTCAVGDKALLVRIRDSIKPATYSATDNSTASASVDLTTV
jgi:hypothetical protein